MDSAGTDVGTATGPGPPGPVGVGGAAATVRPSAPAGPVAAAPPAAPAEEDTVEALRRKTRPLKEQMLPRVRLQVAVDTQLAVSAEITTLTSNHNITHQIPRVAENMGNAAAKGAADAARAAVEAAKSARPRAPALSHTHTHAPPGVPAANGVGAAATRAPPPASSPSATAATGKPVAMPFVQDYAEAHAQNRSHTHAHTQAEEQALREEIARRVNTRPASFQRLDAQTQFGDPSAEDDSELPRIPSDPVAAEIAHTYTQQSGGDVSVRRVIPSGPALATTQAAAIHEKNPRTLENLQALSGAVSEAPGDVEGRKSVALFQTMQMNPSILDTGIAIASSRAHMIAAQMAAGSVPPLALPGSDTVEHVLGTRSADAERPGDATDATTSTDLVAAASRVDAIIPVGNKIDDMLLLRDDIGKDIKEWGPRPTEGSPFDQLMLYNPDEPSMLDRGEIFELFARHRADSEYWTAERLAEQYDTKAEWVEVLLQYTSPPIFVQVDGEAYGVYDIRSTDALPSSTTATQTLR